LPDSEDAVRRGEFEADRGQAGAGGAEQMRGRAVRLARVGASQPFLLVGEAVAIGLAVEARYAVRAGAAGTGLDDAIAGTLSSLGLPIDIPGEFSREEIIRAMRLDKKKHAQSIRFALPVEIGKVELVDVENLENVIAGEAKQSRLSSRQLLGGESGWLRR